MPVSELITPFHLSRQAIIYIRQSSPNQVLTHQESTRLQYALRQRALDCGWSPDSIEVIDADQGLTAELAEGRAGFKEIVARVTLGQVGIIFSYDVTRLSRNLYRLVSRCSTSAVIASASSATVTGSTTPPRPTAASSSG